MGLLQRVAEEAEKRLGLTLIERERVEFLEERSHQFEAFQEEAGELAYHALGYFSGKPSELRPETRQRLSQRSRIALMQDPLAGAEATLLSNFAFGRGITAPDAEDEKVQEILEDAWTDPVNEAKLTGFEAQRHRSNELITQANLYPGAAVRGGRVRIAFLDADTVENIICDPEDEERPLWYQTRKRRQEWDFVNDRHRMVDEMKDGKPKIVYYPHWRHVEDYESEAAEDRDGAKQAGPSGEKRGTLLIEHVRINRIGRTQFGTPPWARSLRFFQALNDVTESHVVMAQAASTLIAKRVVKGTPETIARQANVVLSNTGEIGASRFGADPPVTDRHEEQHLKYRRQLPPGSHWLENQSDTLEALNLNSGASQAAQTAQIVRAPIAANSGFGQHYLGDAGNANLATATSLELPTLMAVQAWQETFEQMLRWFCDLVIQEAARAGRLGGLGAGRVTDEEIHRWLKEGEEVTLSEAEERAWNELPLHEQLLREKPMSLLRVCETEDRRELERRTGRDLTYTLSMPYPGRRNLPDVVALVVGIAAGYDPGGVNVPLRRELLNFLATHGMQIDDPAGWVDSVMPEDIAADLLPGLDPATGAPYTDPRSDDYEPRDWEVPTNTVAGAPAKKSPARKGGASGGPSSKGKVRPGERPRRARTGGRGEGGVAEETREGVVESLRVLRHVVDKDWERTVIEPLLAQFDEAEESGG